MMKKLLTITSCLLTTFLFSQTVTNLSPSSGERGTMLLPVTITGSGTNFSNATSTVLKISQGTSTILEVLGISSVTATSITANVRISNLTPLGLYTVSVYDQTLGDMVDLLNGFSVLNNSTPPVLTGTTPEKAAVGQTLPVTISVDNAHFTQATDNTMHISFQGTNTILYPVPGTIVALNNNKIRAIFDFSTSQFPSGVAVNSYCGNSLDGYFNNQGAILMTVPTSVSGTINYSGTYNGIVEFYQENSATTPSTYSLVGTTPVNGSNGYQISPLAEANYYVRSVPIGMTDVVATYYPADISWQTATLLATSSTPSSVVNITPVTSLSLPGGVTVNGTIGFGPNGFNKTQIVLAEGVEVFLKDTDNTLFAQTTTDQNGEYSFAGLANGNYEIVIDLPGYVQISTYIFNVGSSSSNIDGFDFVIDEGEVFTSNFLSLETLVHENLKLYPNPSSGKLTIELPVNMLNPKMVIYNHLGQIVIEEIINTKIGEVYKTDINQLSAGFYIVRLQGENMNAEARLIKK